jgi:hypothetical protein
MTGEAELGRLHYYLIGGLLRDGRCPTTDELAAALGLTEQATTEWLRDLAAIHGVVLHPHVDEPWIVHPFSTTPTLNFIESAHGSWWAPCLWCAFGVATLAGGACRIHSRLGAAAETVVIHTDGGHALSHQDMVVHFAIPPARAWQNVHQHCALVLPFASERDIAPWCQHRGVTMGEAVPLERVALLARAWYGDHANPQWRKWSIDEAQALFHGAGLTSSFWDLPVGDQRF